MKEIQISANEADQRLDKLLSKYLNLAPKSFIYKMLRKKNIVLNDKKASGNEKLRAGDQIRLYLADETIRKFSEKPDFQTVRKESKNGKAFGEEKKIPGSQKPIKMEELPELAVVYEDNDILLVNKPVGVLSQKASTQDISINEQIIRYLIQNGSYTEEQQRFFTPSVCNRLDRNTSGLLAAGKTLPGSQFLSKLFRDRSIRKYYICLVKGNPKKQHIKGYLTKDHKTNKVTVTKEQISKDSSPIETSYIPLAFGKCGSLLEVHLITGKPHQIRAHLASAGSPIAGDYKYGDPVYNDYFKRRYGLKSQFLHAYRLEMPEIVDKFSYLSRKMWTADPPELFTKILESEKWELGNPGDFVVPHWRNL